MDSRVSEPHQSDLDNSIYSLMFNDVVSFNGNESASIASVLEAVPI